MGIVTVGANEAAASHNETQCSLALLNGERIT